MPVQPPVNPNLPVCRLKAKHILPGSLLLMTMAATHAVHAKESPASQAPSQQTDYHIGSQTLDKALISFSLKSGLQVVADGKLTAGVKSPGVSGRYAPEQALQKLLAGTGVAVQASRNGTVTLEKAAAAVPQSGGETTLKAMTVTGEAVQDMNDPYNKSYTVTNSSIATKTDTPIMETPFSIEVVPRAVMNDQQVIRVEDATKNVSGVQTGSADGNYLDAFIVRGFDIGNNTYRNGYRTQRQQSETANLERIEVLKGAAAMLYGRVQPGGLLNLVTKQPLEIPYYSLQQQFGSYDLYRTTVDATGPILEDTPLLYRINLAYQNNNSFRDFISAERIFIAPSLTWKATPDTQFNLNLEYKHDKGVDDYGVPAVGNRPAPIPISRRLGQPGEGFDNDLLLVNFNAEHAFNDDWKVKLGVNANSNDFSQEDIPPRGLAADNRTLQQGAWFVDIVEDSRGVNLDLTGHFRTLGMEHSVLLGGDYYAWEAKDNGYTNNFSAIGSPIDIYNPVYGGVDFNRLRRLRKNSPDFFLHQRRNGAVFTFKIRSRFLTNCIS